jgi:hypothetical protein
VVPWLLQLERPWGFALYSSKVLQYKRELGALNMQSTILIFLVSFFWMVKGGRASSHLNCIDIARQTTDQPPRLGKTRQAKLLMQK